MKKLSIIFLAVIFLFNLTACGNNNKAREKTNEIVIGVEPTTDKEIIDFLQPEFKKKGLKITTIPFDDYIQPNKQLETGDLDLNFFQHQPYLDNYNKENKTDIVSLGVVAAVPQTIYSTKVKDLKDLPVGGDILIPMDPVNEQRALEVYEKLNIIKLNHAKEGFLTEKDIISNPKKLKFVTMSPQNVTKAFPDAAAASISSDVAVTANLNPQKDALYIGTDNLKPHVIAVLNKNKHLEKYKKFMEVVHSDKCRDFISTHLKGVLVPMF